MTRPTTTIDLAVEIREAIVTLGDLAAAVETSHASVTAGLAGGTTMNRVRDDLARAARVMRGEAQRLQSAVELYRRQGGRD